MKDNYPKAYREVVEVLKYVPIESVNKIPKDMIEMFNEKMDKTYNFSIDIYKKFEEQKLLDETKAILANIFRDYWATPYQKERIEQKEQYNRNKEEELKREKYDINVFHKIEKEKKEVKAREGEINHNNLPVEIKKENFFRKIVKMIKNFLFRR